MELNIIKQEQNPLFNRKEIEAVIKAEVVPSREQVAKLLSEKISSPAEGIRILDINGKFGIKEFKVNAIAYPSKEEMEKIEPPTKRGAVISEKSTQEKPEQEEQKTPAEKETGLNPVEEAKKLDEKKQEEDKKEKEKSKEEKLNE